MATGSEEVIEFWFSEIKKESWFKKDEAFDQLLSSRFGALLQSASQSELYTWRTTAEGRLAEIIVLDQFSRNIFRDTPKAFSNDPLALGLAQEAVALQLDHELTPDKRSFLYMPYMHSESLLVHDQAVDLFTRLGNERTLDYEMRHREIIETYGRYPHRNRILGRLSTIDEIEFLTKPGSSF